MTDIKCHFKINGFFSNRKSLCCLHVCEVLCTVFQKYSNLLIKDILCNHCEVFLPGRCFSAHNEFFTCNRYDFRSGIVTTLQDFSVADDTCNVYWVFPLLVYATNNNGFNCDCYNHRSPKFTGPTLLSVTSKWALCAGFDVTVCGFGVVVECTFKRR